MQHGRGETGNRCSRPLEAPGHASLRPRVPSPRPDNIGVTCHR
jgi:hypothetical protein